MKIALRLALVVLVAAGAAQAQTPSSLNGKYNVTGKVEGNKVSWSFKTDYNGSPLTVSYEGTISSDAKISGASHVAEMSLDGDFTAIKDTDASAK